MTRFARRWRLAAVRLAAVVAAAGALASCASPSRPHLTGRALAPTTATTATSAAPGILAEDLAVGACLSALDPMAVGRVQTTPCANPHRDEVYLVTREAQGQPAPAGAPAPEPYPGDAALAGRARQICHDAFAGYVGRPVEQTELTFTSVYPSEASWAQGRHGIVCLATRPDDAPFTGTVRGGG